MQNIHVLDKKTIDQIAAGEVVERPRSVVKELLENAIDAGAKLITVEIKNGGIDYIRITDNGSGIERDDIKTAFMRHATSKITTIEDLMDVTSLGFRGEALSSIASVARVELLTKTAGSLCGTRYVIEGDKEMVFEDAGVPDGTTMIVRNLFFNVPARRKFLKSATTEGTAIAEMMEHMMLSHPEIAFKFIVNGTVKQQTPGDGKIETVIYLLYGKDVLDLLLPVSYESEEVSIRGYIGKPELCRSNRHYEIFFVNQRNVTCNVLNRSLDEAYKAYLMLHKYPYAILYFDIPSELLDVNVHPAKLEIRLLHADIVYDALLNTSLNALKHKELIPDAEKSTTPQMNTPERILPEPFETRRLSEEIHYRVPETAQTDINAMPAGHDTDRSAAVLQPDREAVLQDTGAKTIPDHILPADERYSQLSFLSEEAMKGHRLIGQLFDTYWLVEYDKKLFLIDQHAAHEKIRYERFVKRYRENTIDSQFLDPPFVLSLSMPEEEVLRTYSEEFKSAGFEIEPFGGREYAMRAVPTELYGITEINYFKELLDSLAQERGKQDMESVLARLATMSCKGAIKAGNRISTAEADALLTELLSLENPYHCPHGRPVIISFTKAELEKKFKRIV